MSSEFLVWLLQQGLPEDAAAEVLRRLEAAKLESLAEFAAGAGHEINNPLAVISGRAAMLLRDEADPERRRLLATIGAQALRIRDMIGDLMVFGRPPEPQPALLDLAEIARSVAERFADEVPPGVGVVCRGDPQVPVWADRTQLCVVLEALLRNSLEALHGSAGRIEIEARASTGHTAHSPPEDPLSRLVVRDTGPGLTETDGKHLFDPFYSGRPAGRGLGFGLAKCWRIVTLHGGRISVDSPQGGPTTFQIDWPAAGRAVAR